jgi:monofunctional biosynthetic peptidoglycan transglycosylase
MILRLLRQKGVLDASEYQIALAESPNVGRMQKKIDEVISTPPVFTAPSSVREVPVEKPAGTEDIIKEEPAGSELPPQATGTVTTNPSESQNENK